MLVAKNFRRFAPTRATHTAVVAVVLLTLLTEQLPGKGSAIIPPAFTHRRRQVSSYSSHGLSNNRHPVLNTLVDIHSSLKDSNSVTRPQKCADNTAYFIDCYICAKTHQSAIIYHGCCEGNAEIVRFCTLHLLQSADDIAS